jgi:tetratricopeptide (TPR) repeat protein
VARGRPDTRQATETLHEIEGAFDRLGQWVSTHPVQVLVGLGVVLLLAAAVGFADWYRDRSLDRAAAAVADVQAEYLRAMGARPGTYEIVEPANPETGRRVRAEYVDRFLAVAEAHAGTAAAVSALLEAGTLQEEMGDPEAALATWERAQQQAEPGSALRGLAGVRLARGLEQQGRWAEAAAAHEEAGSIASLPTRALALADAARCYAEAGEREKAVAVYERLLALEDAPPPPDHVKARLEELSAGS